MLLLVIFCFLFRGKWIGLVGLASDVRLKMLPRGYVGDVRLGKEEKGKDGGREKAYGS